MTEIVGAAGRRQDDAARYGGGEGGAGRVGEGSTEGNVEQNADDGTRGNARQEMCENSPVVGE